MVTDTCCSPTVSSVMWLAYIREQKSGRTTQV